jgi:lipoprotein-anchoring transpeptidase ErfK/SrfK
MRQVVAYDSDEAVGTIIVSTGDKYLYLILGGGKAMRYGIGTARDGFEWSGIHSITRKAEWPGWTPPAEMKLRRPDLPDYMPGGRNNPLGARALYIGSTLYRIHGTNEPWTIGGDVSSGCIRMVNADVVDLYERVKIGAKVIVL